MSYQLKRITTVPATAVQVTVSDKRGATDGDAGLSAGGQFSFPVGGEVQTVSDYATGVLMGDPGTAKHFNCMPPWRSAVEPVPVASAEQDDDQGAEASPEE